MTASNENTQSKCFYVVVLKISSHTSGYGGDVCCCLVFLSSKMLEYTACCIIETVPGKVLIVINKCVKSNCANWLLLIEGNHQSVCVLLTLDI